ncbi:hypothetical protein LshimejAT787_0409100 [Lyophyllum shimeji]|uniref:DUF6534 domain-containing protein n=1 Tax=Lyophyllum shimeji TaxID=47721 RepID=A0A9P3PLY1_LYOSH|nr:hypothetical protein LshimejAT787_0409100 [Lyophyllum shimeji]
MASSSSSVMTDDESQLSKSLLGPWLVGSVLDIFFLGALSSQFINYFSWYGKDRLGTQLAVIGLVVLSILQSIHTFAIAWIMFVLYFKDLYGAINLNFTACWQLGNPIMIASVGLYVQIFFCHRLWHISQKKIRYVLPVGFVLFIAYASVCVATYDIHRQSTIAGRWFAAHFSCVFAGDLMITLSSAYLLLKSRSGVMPQTGGVLAALARLSFQTAAPVALCALLNLILSQVYNGKNLVSVPFNMMMPKLYAFSMMLTLNARRALRAQAGLSDDGAPSAGSSGRRRADVVRSTYVGRIEVRTRTDVSRHIDFNESAGSGDQLQELRSKG